MRSLCALGSLVLLLASAAPAVACMSGYEPPESILKRAGHVVEVLVLAVSPETSHDRWGRDGERTVHRAVEGGRARVRILRELRGRMPVREFTLRGGPYRSCAPWECFYDFEVGQSVWLLLDGPVPEGTELVEIGWRGRVFSGTAGEVEAMLERMRVGRERRLALLRKVVPEARARAEKLAEEIGAGRELRLEEEPPAVLMTLGELLEDPLSPRPYPPVRHPDGTWRAGPSRGRPLPAALLSALEPIEKEPPESVKELNGRLLLAWLTGHLRQPEGRARAYVAARNREDELPPELASVETLMMLAADDPAPLARTSPRFEPGRWVPEVFAPWLRAHADEVPARRPWLPVCLSLGHPSAAPVAVRALEGENARGWYPELFGFFLAVRADARAEEVVVRVEELRNFRREALARDVGEMLEAAGAAGERAGHLGARLEALRFELEK